MKKLNLLLFALLCISFTANANPFDIEDEISFARVDPFLKIFRESSFFPEFKDTTHYAAGEHATMQFVIRSGKRIKNLKASLPFVEHERGNKLTGIEAGFVEYVRVSRKTPDRAKDAIVPPSLYYPDPILVKESYEVGRDVAQPIWVSIPIPENAKPGTYKGKFTITGEIAGNNFKLEREVIIEVHPVILETPQLWVTNWFTTSPKAMKIFNGGKDVEPYSDAYWGMIRELAKKMKVCYQNVILLSPLEHVKFAEKNGKYSFDFTQFDKMVSIFQQEGVLKMIEGGHIAGREGLWDSQFAVYVPEMENGKQVKKQYRISEPKAKNFYSQFIPALMKHVREKGWGNYYSQHIADEPITANISSYVEIAKFVKELDPQIKIIEACHSHNLENVLDIWVPQLNYYKDGYKFYTERQEKGDEVWFYTCLAPQGDYANRFLEQPLIKTRLIHWLNFKYGATGYLHWGFNYWLYDNPFLETTRMNEESGNTLPGGDSWIVYPENGKLHGSLRLEAMRDGIADFTLLKMLERKNPELAKELCRLTVFHWTLYDTEGDHFRNTRRQILEALAK